MEEEVVRNPLDPSQPGPQARASFLRMTATEVSIDDLSHDGRGVARLDGKALFVTGALPGERVRVRITRRHRHYDEAAVVELLTASSDRVVPRCAHYDICAGCSLQHLAPAAQIAAKQRVLAENLERIGRLQPRRWLPALTAEPWGYRRKGRLSVRWVEKKGRVLVGFREANPQFVADLRRCEVLDPALGPQLGALGELLGTLDAARSIPQIEFAAGDAALVLVLRHLQPLSVADRARLAGLAREHGWAIWLQPGGIDSVHPLEAADAVELSYTLPASGTSLAFRPLDFIQVNAAINRAMVDRALELLDPQPHQRVLDLFAGLGNFTLPIARRVATVTGIEGEVGLVQRAVENATRNGIDNARFFSADLFADQRGAMWAREPWDALLLDPPRAGAQQLLEYLPQASTRRVVYVSCHPGSLARDAATLARRGFTLDAAGVMDMFPHTAHVESIALFERA